MIGARAITAPIGNVRSDQLAMTAIDLFAGAGGTTQGLKDAGFRVLAAIEWDQDAAKSLSLNHPEVQVLARDIRDIRPSDLLSGLEVSETGLTLMTACPPCQGFSSLGARNHDDPRNDLIREVSRFVQAFLPDAVLVENVPGLAANDRWSRFGAELDTAGYKFRPWIVDAVDYGVSQRRRRLVGVGIRRDSVEFPDDLRDILPTDFRLSAPAASQVIAQAGPIAESDDVCHRARQVAPLTLKRIRAIPRGGNQLDLPFELQLACHKRLRRAGRKAATGPYGRILANGPAPTMTTRCTTVSSGRFIHPIEDRGISLREAALLQSFPLDYSFTGTHESIERQIGNAVPVRLAHALGLVVARLLRLIVPATESEFVEPSGGWHVG